MLKSNFEKRISKPIVTLATTGVALGVAVMILSVSVAVGFQTEVRDKVLGFGGHVQVTKIFSNDSHETEKIEIDQEWIEDVLSEENVNLVQQIAYKPGIIQSKSTSDTTNSGKDIRDMSGMIFKGIAKDFDKEFLDGYLIEGQFPKFDQKGKKNDSILISRYTADQLQVNIYDKVSCFFVSNNEPLSRNFTIGGIYETGLEDFDKKFTYIDIAQIRSLNKWGIEVYLSIEEECSNGLFILRADAFGGNGNYRYKWDKGGYSESNRIPICLDKDEFTIQVVATDVETDGYLGQPKPASIPDTAWLSIKTFGQNSCNCSTTNHDLKANYISESVTEYSIDSVTIQTVLRTSGGSDHHYCGGFEILMNDWESLSEAKKTVQFYTNNVLHIQSIVDRNEDIFNWLSMLDLNVYIIISLMILVALINMTSALLVIILERTRMIGILKSLGSRDWSVRKIFLINGGFLVLKGLLWGNILGIGIILLQNQFGFLTLSQSNYYVSTVPMHYQWIEFIMINFGTYFIANLALIVPSMIITKISPVKAIKFE